MIKIGITGGIGSGKSVVSRILQVLDIPIYIADDEAKKLMVTDPHIKKSLIALLGNQVYLDGQLNKKLLANYLFAKPEHTKEINDIVHPRVKEDFLTWCEKNQECPIVGIESAILFEAGFKNAVDYSILVYASEEVRLERAIKRDKSTAELIAKRIAAQTPDREKLLLTDFLVYNDGNIAILPQVLFLLQELKKTI